MRFLPQIFSLFTSISATSINLSPRQASSSSIACNNSPDLCSKPYNSITHLGAHDSPFVRDASTGYSSSGNQYYNSTVQLSAGVRLLSAQVHLSNGQWHLCHSSCDLLDAGTLSTWLGEIKQWMDNNTNEVVTLLLVNSDNATPSQLAQEFEDAQITNYAYNPPSIPTASATWPTIQELISTDKRLMVFVASLDNAQILSGQEYLMDEFTFIFENPFDNTAFSDFTCLPDRPTAVKGNIQSAISSNRMPLMNHFLDSEGIFDIQTPDRANVSFTNSPGSAVGNLGQAASTCNTQYGKQPTFILVDFFDMGPALATIDSLNGVTNIVGRSTPPPHDSEEDGSSRKVVTFQGVVELAQQVREGQKPKLGAWIWAAGLWTWGGINLNGGQVFS